MKNDQWVVRNMSNRTVPVAFGERKFMLHKKSRFDLLTAFSKRDVALNTDLLALVASGTLYLANIQNGVELGPVNEDALTEARSYVEDTSVMSGDLGAVDIEGAEFGDLLQYNGVAWVNDPDVEIQGDLTMNRGTIWMGDGSGFQGGLLNLEGGKIDGGGLGEMSEMAEVVAKQVTADALVAGIGGADNIAEGQMTFGVDEAGENLIVIVKLPDGTMKEAKVPLSSL